MQPSYTLCHPAQPRTCGDIANLEKCFFQVDGLLQISFEELERLAILDRAAIQEFLQLNESTAQAIRTLLNISIHFSNNHAQKAGSAVFGG